MKKKTKIFNDPIHNFIELEYEPFVNLIDTQIFQRLRNLSQLGLCSYVFPGALHTRFLHSLGATWLMKIAIDNLCQKNVEISEEEKLATMSAILLHDIGHGPLSHTLEGQILAGISHEAITKKLILKLKDKVEFNSELTLQIFEGNYKKLFLHELVSSQLDVDRLDYLKRDSSFTGVTSGNVGVMRILKNLNVYEDRLIVESKGLYDVENYVVARYFMYWQVYFHKTVLAADTLLKSIFQRIRDLFYENPNLKLEGSKNLIELMTLKKGEFELEQVLEKFITLDDNDLFFSIKLWQEAEDEILSDLAKRFYNRRFFKTKQIPTTKLIDADTIRKIIFKHLPKEVGQNPENLKYYFKTIESKQKAYSYFASKSNTPIKIIFSDGTINEFADTVDTSYIKALTQEVNKNFVCYLKEANEEISKILGLTRK